MADIFGRFGAGRGSGFGGAFRANAANIVFTVGAGGAAIDLNKVLTTQVTANYSQAVNRVYDLQSDNAYYVMGRTNGNGAMGAVFGPKGQTVLAYETMADPCSQVKMSINYSSATCENDNTRGSRSLTGLVLQNVGFSVNSQDMMINENLQFLFATMQAA